MPQRAFRQEHPDYLAYQIPNKRSEDNGSYDLSGSSSHQHGDLSSCHARGGTRTRTGFPPGDFKSPVSAIPPPGQKLRRRRDSNPGITVLQTVALATWLRRQYLGQNYNRIKNLLQEFNSQNRVQNLPLHLMVLLNRISRHPVRRSLSDQPSPRIQARIRRPTPDPSFSRT